MQLRPYQQAAVDAVYEYLRKHDDNPCVVVPTAGGKTPILATIVRDAVSRWNGRVMIISHVKELLAQAEEKIRLVAPDIDAGVYSSGLNRFDTDNPCVIAGIQSVFRRPEAFGRFDLVIVDEAHMIQPKGDGMYRSCISKLKEINPLLRVIGLTATPYRMTSGMICKPENILNRICYEVGIKDLMNDGFLAKLTNKEAKVTVDASGLHIRGGEFVEKEVQELVNQAPLIEKVVAELVNQTKARKSVLVFCAGIEHAENVLAAIRKYSDSADAVFGDTLPGFRESIIADFKARKIKYLV